MVLNGLASVFPPTSAAYCVGALLAFTVAPLLLADRALVLSSTAQTTPAPRAKHLDMLVLILGKKLKPSGTSSLFGLGRSFFSNISFQRTRLRRAAELQR